MKMTAEESLLRRIGVDFQSPAPGCCGMAGSFGFEHDKYEVSAAIGELELLPAVRNAPAGWLIIADGFSCREQIAQGTNRHALHVAEVLQMALNPPLTNDSFPESAIVNQRHAEVRSSMQRAGLGLTAIAAGSALLWAWTATAAPDQIAADSGSNSLSLQAFLHIRLAANLAVLDITLPPPGRLIHRSHIPLPARCALKSRFQSEASIPQEVNDRFWSIQAFDRQGRKFMTLNIQQI